MRCIYSAFSTSSRSKFEKSHRKASLGTVPKKLKAILVFCLFVSLLFVLSGFFGDGRVAFASLAEERAKLEEELAELETQIEGLSGVVQDTQKKRTTLERDIAILNAKSGKIKLEIRAYDIRISNLSDDIYSHSQTIDVLSGKMQNEKDSLAELIRRTNEMDSFSLVELVVGYDTLSDFFVDVDFYEELQGDLQASLGTVRDTKDETETEREKLINRKTEQSQLRAIQELEKKNLSNFKAQKNNILKITRGEEERYQKLLAEKKESAAEIRTRIFRLFGGGELPFGEAVKIAQFAEKATGIRAAFLLAVLAQESAIDGVIGRNLGQCYYNTPRNNRSGTVMSNTQKPSFLAIMTEIGMDPNTTPVSCPIASDGAYGGAMGPAQFMPTTWWNVKHRTGYKKRVAKITGNNPPSPFNNSDAFIAAASYLHDAYNSSACDNYAQKNKHISPVQLLQERCTAAKYYAGSNWYKFRWAYGEPVVERAAKFQDDIDIINKSD